MRENNDYIKQYNPCYHCYTGAIGECALAHCKYRLKSWSGDVESEEIWVHEKEAIAEYIKE